MDHSSAAIQRDETRQLAHCFPTKAKVRQNAYDVFVAGRPRNPDWNAWVMCLFFHCRLPKKFAMPDDTDPSKGNPYGSV